MLYSKPSPLSGRTLRRGSMLASLLAVGLAGPLLAQSAVAANPAPPTEPRLPEAPGDEPAPGDGLPTYPPGLPQLPPGSAFREVVLTLGGASCARGDPYAVFVQDGDPDKLLIDFTGGGACASAETCDVAGATFFPDLKITRLLVGPDHGLGIFAASRTDNPVKGWTHIVVPNCTGDLNLGASDQTYTRQDGTSFTIKHRGAANTRAALAWIKQLAGLNHAAPSQVRVIGSSAGSYASVLWTPAIQELFPQAKVRQLGDCGAGVSPPFNLLPSFPSQWNIAGAFPASVPGLNPEVDDVDHASMETIYRQVAQAYPQIDFSQFNYNHDHIQSYFFRLLGNNSDDWTPLFYTSMAALKLTTANFYAFIAPGTRHAVLIEPQMYTLNAGGEAFTAWFSQYLSAKPLHDVITEP